jgi:hypothetical protein
MVENALQHFLFPLTGSDECDLGRMIQDWEGESNATWGWLWGIFDGGDPTIGFIEEFVPREE